MILLLAIALAAGSVSAVRHSRVSFAQKETVDHESEPAPPVSILKPIRGADAGLRDAIASHVALQGDFELLCGVALAWTIRPWPCCANFRSVRIVECPTRTPNGKVGVLMDLAAAAAKSPF